MLEKTEGAIRNRQSRETGNIWAYKTEDEDKQKNSLGSEKVKDPWSFEIWMFHNGQPDGDDAGPQNYITKGS